MIKRETYYIFFPFVVLYFFLNNFLLPQGLLYTSILSPVFLYWLYKKHRFSRLLKWGVLLLIPIPFHLLTGIDMKSYIISTLMVFAVWIFLFTGLKAVEEMNESLEEMFPRIMIINAVMIFIALLLLPFKGLSEFMWDYTPISPGVQEFPRLMLLAYEPSHYALLLSPVFIYFILKILSGKSTHPLVSSLGIAIPLILSLSFGVIGAIFLAVIAAGLIYYKKLPASSGSFLFNLLILFVIVLVVISFIWPSNPVFERIENIFAGDDTSAKGRLTHSFMFAFDLVNKYNVWMGVGPGQVKILAHDFIVDFYNYYGVDAKTVRIPNAMGEILAVYGFYGFLLKLFFEIYYFVRMKIYNNLFSLSLFIFVFIYQFTGSFLTNVAEIGIWALVFGSRISTFEYDRLKRSSG